MELVRHSLGRLRSLLHPPMARSAANTTLITVVIVDFRSASQAYLDCPLVENVHKLLVVWPTIFSMRVRHFVLKVPPNYQRIDFLEVLPTHSSHFPPHALQVRCRKRGAAMTSR